MMHAKDDARYPNPQKAYFLAQKVYFLEVYFLAKVYFLQKDDTH